MTDIRVLEERLARIEKATEADATGRAHRWDLFFKIVPMLVSLAALAVVVWGKR